ncbi:MAG TPA: head GIN domain-containing protein [Rhodocyclaceae bacterium]|nr:head GIN domain-containing protein [Rhodocyclaceae bacterium]
MSLAASAAASDTAIEQRTVSGIERVVMGTTGELVIRQGASESLQIESEARLLPKIASEVRDGTLHLHFRTPQASTTYPLVFRLTVKQLESLDSTASADVHIGALRSEDFVLTLGGSGDIAVDALEARSLEARLSGAGTISIGGGRVDRQILLLEGAGDYFAGGLASRHAEIDIDGSGTATVHAGERLVVRIAGSGDVLYHGTPRIDEQISGAGSVQPAGSR